MSLTNKTALLSLALGVTALGACNEDLLNPMADRQPRVNAYSLSEFYDDQQTMRQPPANTVPRERLTGSEEITSGRRGGAYVTSIPIKIDASLMKLGRKRYDITCGTCHGPLGDGKSIVATQMALRPPPSLIPYADRPAGYIYDVITKGFGLMGSYANDLNVRERWAVVAYVRALQISQTATLDQAPPDVRQRLQASTGDELESAPGAAPGAAEHPGTGHKE
jgi:mono/diheme cytochrome c family protein